MTEVSFKGKKRIHLERRPGRLAGTVVTMCLKVGLVGDVDPEQQHCEQCVKLAKQEASATA